jgi:putative membrane protein
MMLAWAPTWTPHPDVWLILGMLVAAYVLAAFRVGPNHVLPGTPAVTRRQAFFFAGGMLTLWIASDYPLHDIAEQSMYSFHMIQHLTISMLAVPLLLLGTPGWMMRALLKPRWLFRTLRFTSRFFPAIVIFNVVLVLSHWPAVVNATVGNGFEHFLAHCVIFLAAVSVWMPIVSPIPEIPRFSPIQAMTFLFTQSVVPTIPASFLTFGTSPLYDAYINKPKMFGATALSDQQFSGLIMKIGAGLLLWSIITVIFFKWSTDEDRRNQNVPRRAWQDSDRELTQTGST